MSFERWTERARQIVVLAQECARSLNHGYIGTEHLLYGLAEEGGGIAARLLRDHDVTPDRICAQIKHVVGVGEPGAVLENPLPFTERFKKVQEAALREALSLGSNYISTEHILLALVRVNEGIGARILDDWEIGAEAIRNEVIRALSGPQKPKPTKAAADPGPLTEAADHALEALRLVNAEMERRARANDEISLSPSANQLRSVVASLSQFAKNFEAA